MSSVFDKSPICQQFYSDRKPIRDLRGGTIAMRKAGNTYLPKEPRETPKGYQARLERTVLTPFGSRVVKNLSSKPFSRPIIITSEKYPELAEMFSKNIDGKGTSVSAFGKAVFEDSMWQGSSFICVDAPLGGGAPYAYWLSADDIVGYRMDEDLQLSEIRIRETATVDDGEWGEKSIERARAFRKRDGRVMWSLWERGEGGEDMMIEPWQAFGLDEIPVAYVHSNPAEVRGTLFCPPPLTDLCFMNIAHWQQYSDMRHIIHVASVPILFGKGIPEECELVIGIDQAVVGSENSDLKYVEHTGSAISTGRQALVDLENNMASFGIEMLQNTGAVETATGRALRAGENNNQVAAMAAGLESALEKVFGWMARFSRVSTPDFVVDVHKDYGINASVEQLTALATARANGDLSQHDYITELKRRGVLRDDFNIEDNADRLSTEYVAA